MVIGDGRAFVAPSMTIRMRSGTTALAGLVTTVPSIETRPPRISARASVRLASPSFEIARSSGTWPLRAVIAKLEGDPEIFRPQRRHRGLQFVFRRRRDAQLVGLNLGLHLLHLEILQ